MGAALIHADRGMDGATDSRQAGRQTGRQAGRHDEAFRNSATTPKILIVMSASLPTESRNLFLVIYDSLVHEPKTAFFSLLFEF